MHEGADADLLVFALDVWDRVENFVTVTEPDQAEVPAAPASEEEMKATKRAEMEARIKAAFDDVMDGSRTFFEDEDTDYDGPQLDFSFDREAEGGYEL